MDKKELIKFIALAHKNTYAAPKEIRLKHKCEKPLVEGHEDYHYQEGDWDYHDMYAGSFWAPGSEVVLYKGKPVWRMSYQGKTSDKYSDEFYKNEAFVFLRKALMNFSDDLPFRGPEELKDGDFTYEFKLEGNTNYFVGREIIRYKGEIVFFQDVMGELIK